MPLSTTTDAYRASELTIGKLLSVLEEEFPLNTQESWDNSGLLVGDTSAIVDGIMFCVDITTDVISEAIERDCNVVIAHHPLMFKGLHRLTDDTSEQKAIKDAILNNVALIALHTPLDKSPLGPSAAIAFMLGLTGVEILVPERNPQNESEPIGFGVVGVLDQAIGSNDFLALLKKRLNCEVIRHNGYDTSVKKVAICTGSGSEFVGTAIRKAADAYITADMKYHQMADAANDILVTDIGHYESERVTMEIIKDVITRKILNFASLEMYKECNPIKYYY